ncbi:MAG: cbb3-type cytochrome c oxidase subunit I [bacterium]|nr:cbb3-type cytochrome c oxidase subunit I [bacterium]
MFGRLTLDAFIHSPVETVPQLVVVTAALICIFLLFYYKRWGWLYREWLVSVDHKKISIMYFVLAAVMLARGMIDAGMMRVQQAVAVPGDLGYLTPDHYAQIFTAHGVIMIFFVAMPFMFALLNLAVPLLIGSRDVAYPFLNSVSFWLTAAGAMLVNFSLVVGEFAATGWLAYPPLSELAYSPGVGVDYYIWALQIAGVGTLIAGINFLVTIIKLRAPGMTLMRMPMFVWTALGSMILVIFAFPILTATLAMLALDRIADMHFFTTTLGGNAMMYINLIWSWGHPEVYILILPAFGIFSEIVPVFSKKKLFGYTSMVVATMLIVLLSFIVWGHHFFTMGTNANVNAFFGIMTMVIAIPTGVKVFNWLFTMFRGRITFDTPMLWFIGFLTTFVLGGMTGVLLAIPGANFQLHNSLFLVAHFHNMVIGGVLFGFFAGFTYWFPKLFGFRLNEKLGKYAFWCWLVGFLVAFLPLYFLGLMGATRRLVTIDASWQPLFIVAALGVGIIAVAIGFQILQLIVSIRDRKKNIAGSDPSRLGRSEADPWDGRTLEWSTSSPPPHYNFATIPHVHGRDPHWYSKQEGAALTGSHEEKIEIPNSSPIGFIIALCATAFGFGIVWHIWWLAALGLIAIIACIITRSFDEKTEYTLHIPS